MPRDEADRQVIEGINRSFHCLSQQIRHTTFQGEQICYCPLFLVDTSAPALNPGEIDVCAVSLAISVLSADENKSSDKEELLKGLVKMLLKARNANGGWPSYVTFADSGTVRMEGVVGEVVWGIRALLEVGLPTFDQRILTINALEQLQLMQDNIEWLKKNGLKQGWYYTELSCFDQSQIDSLQPMVMPTAQIVIILRRVEQAINDFMKILETRGLTDREKKPYETICKKCLADIDNLCHSSINWLLAFGNSDGGYGIAQGSPTTLSNTSLALLALMTDDTKDSFYKAKKAFLRLLKMRVKNLTHLPDSEVYECFHQIYECDEGSECIARRRQIQHEKYIEGLILTALVRSATKKWAVNSNKSLIEDMRPYSLFRYYHLIKRLTSRLMSLQEKEGTLMGSFKGRKPYNDSHPTYGLHDAISSLMVLSENFVTVYRAYEFRSILFAIILFLVSVTPAIFLILFFKQPLYKTIALSVAAGAVLSGSILGLGLGGTQLKRGLGLAPKS